MKNFTLLAFAALTMGTVAQAQVKQPLHRSSIHTASPLDQLKARLGFPVKVQKATSGLFRMPSALKPNKAKQAVKLFEQASAAKYLAQHREEYFPIESEDESATEPEWELGGSYDITYDGNGNILQELYDDGETVLRTTNTWNSKGKLSEEIQAVSEDGGETFTNSSRRVQSYDSYFPQLTTSKTKYDWDENLHAWKENGDAFRRKLKRDADNNVTYLALSVPYEGGYDEITRLYNTFSPDTKQAVTHVNQSLKGQEDGEDVVFVWKATDCLTDMVWHETNGQLVDVYDNWMEYGNRLTSATLNDVEDNDTIPYGTINIEYNDDDKGFVEVVSMDDGMTINRTELTYTDENGSYEYWNTESMVEDPDADPVVMGGTMQIAQYDDLGNLTLEEAYEWNDSLQDYEQVDGSLYEITYDTENPTLQKSVVISSFNYDEHTYEPFMKLEFSDYVNVTGINNVVKHGGAANAPAVYYNLQGVRTLNPSHGVYLMKQGNVVRKVIK